MTIILPPPAMPRSARVPRPVPPLLEIPALHNGDRLTQPEFHRRYEAMPPGVKAELIGGTVYMPSPLRMPHSTVHSRLTIGVGTYQAETPGVDVGSDATVILGHESEPQPDLHVRILPEYGGATREDADQYLVGGPELIIEVAHSSEALDLHAKRLDYERAAVREYLVFCIRERALRAFDLKTGRELSAGADGIYRSRAFPGLWLDPAAAFDGDTRRLLRVVRKGLRSPEHAAFVTRLTAKGPKARSRAVRRRPRGRQNGTE